MIFFEKSFIQAITLSLIVLIMLFHSCNTEQDQLQEDKETLDLTYLAFAKRTKDIFGKSSYPMYFPLKEGHADCNAFQLCFNRNINITDTIQGIILIEDSNRVVIDYQLEGFDEFFIENRKDNEIYIFPKKKDIIGYYFYRFTIPKNKIPYTVKLITSQDTIVLYKEGDRKGLARENFCDYIYSKYDYETRHLENYKQKALSLQDTFPLQKSKKVTF